jgi:hypothetical protein
MTFNLKGLNQTWNQLLSVKRIDRLMKVLELLEPAISNKILSRLAKKLVVDNPLLYQELRKTLMVPGKVMNQLDQAEVGRIWKSLTLDERECLASRMDSDTLKSYGFNPDQYEDDIEIDEKEYWKSVIKFYDHYYDLLDKGLIRPIDLPENHIRIPTCYSSDTTLKEKIRIVQKDQVLIPEQAVQLFLFCQDINTVSCELRLTKTDQKGSKHFESAIINFDATGYASWNSMPLFDTGMYEIILEEKNASDEEAQPIARTEILVVPTEERTFDIIVNQIKWHGTQVNLKGTLLFGNAPTTTELAIQLICACGNVIDESWASVEKGELEIELDTANHLGPWFIDLSSFKSQVKGLIPLNKKPTDNILVSPKAKIEGDKEAINLNRFAVKIKHEEPSKLVNGILIAAPVYGLTHHFEDQFLDSIKEQPFLQGQFSNFNSRLQNQSLNLRLGQNFINSQVFRINSKLEWRKEIFFNSANIPSSWQVSFFQRLSKNEFALIKKSLKTPLNTISAQFPNHILEGDRVEGTLNYNNQSPLELEISGRGNLQHKRLVKSGSVPIQLTSSSQIHLKATGNNEFNWDYDWKNRPFGGPGKRVSYHPKLLKKGEEIHLKNGRLYPNIDHWILKTAVSLQSYGCRCGEQTSSIIGGLLIIRHYLEKGLKHTKYTLSQIDELLNCEIDHLASMQHPSGRMSLWLPSGNPPQFPQSSGLNIVVMENLKRLKEVGHKKGLGLLKKIQSYLKSQKKNPYQNDMEKLLLRLKTGKIDADDQQHFLKLVKESLIITNRRFHITEADHFKYDVYFLGVILEYLMRMNFPPIKYTSRMEKQINRESGLLLTTLDKLRIRKLKEESVENRNFETTQDPLYLIVRLLVGSVNSGGYWGTNSTVRALESLIMIAPQRSFQGEFLVNGKNSPLSIETTTAVHDKTITVLSDEAIVAETYEVNPLEELKQLNEPPSDAFKGGITIRTRDDQMELGKPYAMDIEIDCPHIPHPIIEIYQSGYLGFRDWESDIFGDETCTTIAVPQKRRIDTLAIRRGKGHLICKVADMYDPYHAYKLEVPIEVV